MARWILGQPLQFSPGEQHAYSNVGYFFLGLIIEERTGQTYFDYLLSTVLDPAGIEPHEVQLGRTRRAARHAREPWYDSGRMCESVLRPGTEVECAYGGWAVEGHVATGGLIASTKGLLGFLDKYYVIGSRIGLERKDRAHGHWKLSHTGGVAGTSALARQRGDGIH
jgi:N-acyl-D-amino-acid deacylase